MPGEGVRVKVVDPAAAEAQQPSPTRGLILPKLLLRALSPSRSPRPIGTSRGAQASGRHVVQRCVPDVLPDRDQRRQGAHPRLDRRQRHPGHRLGASTRSARARRSLFSPYLSAQEGPRRQAPAPVLPQLTRRLAVQICASDTLTVTDVRTPSWQPSPACSRPPPSARSALS